MDESKISEIAETVSSRSRIEELEEILVRVTRTLAVERNICGSWHNDPLVRRIVKEVEVALKRTILD